VMQQQHLTPNYIQSTEMERKHYMLNNGIYGQQYNTWLQDLLLRQLLYKPKTYQAHATLKGEHECVVNASIIMSAFGMYNFLGSLPITDIAHVTDNELLTNVKYNSCYLAVLMYGLFSGQILPTAIAKQYQLVTHTSLLSSTTAVLPSFDAFFVARHEQLYKELFVNFLEFRVFQGIIFDATKAAAAAGLLSLRSETADKSDRYLLLMILMLNALRTTHVVDWICVKVSEREFLYLIVIHAPLVTSDVPTNLAFVIADRPIHEMSTTNKTATS